MRDHRPASNASDCALCRYMVELGHKMINNYKLPEQHVVQGAYRGMVLVCNLLQISVLCCTALVPLCQKISRVMPAGAAVKVSGSLREVDSQ